MVWHKDKWLSLILSEFLNISRQVLGQNVKPNRQDQ
jgi:hypothetical protein